MTFEPHPREFFAPDQAPTRLTSLREKLELFAELGLDAVLVSRFDYDFARIAAEEFVERILVRGLAVRWLLVGDDFRFGARRAGDFDLLARAGREHGFEVVRMDTCAVDGVRVSSTAVRQRLAAGDLDGAARLLGRPYSISGRVVRGDRLGRAARIPDRQRAAGAQPSAADGDLRGRGAGAGPAPLPGVASLGVRPTVKDGGAPTLEVHLFDFDRDIYGRRVQVRFLQQAARRGEVSGPADADSRDRPRRRRTQSLLLEPQRRTQRRE